MKVLRKTCVENGQILVESLLVIPFFFVMIGGMVAWASREHQVTLDSLAIEAAALAPEGFLLEERKAGDWNHEGNMQTLLDFIYHPAQFTSSSYAQNGVFKGRERLQQGAQCVSQQQGRNGGSRAGKRLAPTYNVSDNADFLELTTCAPSATGYWDQRAALSPKASGIEENQVMRTEKQDKVFVVPSSSGFAWDKRDKFITLKGVSFGLFLRGEFLQRFAKHRVGQSFTNTSQSFNAQIFMENQKNGVEDFYYTVFYASSVVQAIVCLAECLVKDVTGASCAVLGASAVLLHAAKAPAVSELEVQVACTITANAIRYTNRGAKALMNAHSLFVNGVERASFVSAGMIP